MTRHLWPRLVVVFGLGLTAQADAAQVCADVPSQSDASASRFTHEADGTTVDQQTQLMWMRCPLGQRLAGASCAGQAARESWQSGFAAAEQINRSGSHFYNDWRVPSLRELASVTERHCQDPRIDLRAFPGTPAAAFWTGTASLKSQEEAYALDFGAGGVQPADRASRLHVRLVRSAP